MAYPTDHLTKSDVPFAEDGRRHGVQGLAHEALQTDGVLGRFIASLA